MRYFLIKTIIIINFVLVLLMLGCNTSSLSNEKIADVHLLGVSIEIKQDPFDKNKNHIVLLLFDEKRKQIENRDIKIFVNGQELELYVKKELYYTKRVRYIGSDIPVDDSFYFEIELSDGKVVPLAFSKSNATVEKRSIQNKEEESIDDETEIIWSALKDYDSLSVYRTYKINNETSYGGGPYGQSTIQKNIKGEGSFKVPTSFYQDSVSTITTLHFQFHARKKGLIYPDLLDGSKLRLTSIIKKGISINSDSLEKSEVE